MHPPPLRRFQLLLAALALTLAGCGSATIGGKKGFSTANDQLRARVGSLEDENRLLRAQRDELSAKLAEEQRIREGAIGAEVLAAIPRCAGVEIDSLSGADPVDPSLPVRGFVLYLRPFDGQRRFVQIVGAVRAEVVELADRAGSQEPRVIASASLTPAQLRDTYRSGLTGTHYEIRLPAGDPAQPRSHALLMRVQFDDAITGKAHEATLNMPPRGSTRGASGPTPGGA